MTVIDRVQAGMAFLDRHFPDHVERFDPETFDIMCMPSPGDDFSRSCVLMQATDSDTWERAATMAGIRPGGDEPMGLGFMPSVTGRIGFRLEAQALNRTWLDAYSQRKDQRLSS